MSTDNEPMTTRAHLLAIQREYYMTVRVLGNAIEQLLRFTGGESLEVTDAALADAPDLDAWRNDDRGSVELTVKR